MRTHGQSRPRTIATLLLGAAAAMVFFGTPQRAFAGPEEDKKACQEAADDCDLCVEEKLVEAGVCAGTVSLVISPIGGALFCTGAFFTRASIWCGRSSDCKKAEECRNKGIIKVFKKYVPQDQRRGVKELNIIKGYEKQIRNGGVLRSRKSGIDGALGGGPSGGRVKGL